MDPFVAEIRIFPFNFAPKGWAWCDGQLLPLSQNTALFSLLGTTYGGDGKSNFALPDLQGRAPMHPGQGPGLSLHSLGEAFGTETVTLLESEIPAHPHGLRGNTIDLGDTNTPSPNAAYAQSSGGTLYQTTQNTQLGPGGAVARRRRPAAQQPPAVPDALLQHRAAGRLPAAHVAPWARSRCGRSQPPTSRSRCRSTHRRGRRSSHLCRGATSRRRRSSRCSSRRRARTTPSTTPGCRRT